MGQYQALGGPLVMHFRRSAEEPNQDTMRDSIDLKPEHEMGGESEQAQE